MNYDKLKDIKIEDIIWVIFIILSILSIYGNYLEKIYLKTNNKEYDNTANKIFEFTLIITLIAYLYFLYRNYIIYNNIEDSKKELYSYKVLGTLFLVIGILILLYFQEEQKSFVGSPII